MNFKRYFLFLILLFLFPGCGKNPLLTLQNLSIPSKNKLEKWEDVKSFVYILQNIDISKLKKSKFDLIIMDYSADGTDENRFSYEEINSLKNSIYGKKFVICYISIGEAESYRYYWQPNWEVGNPDFIDEENPDWEGNYKVKYWSTNWQKILLGNDLSSNTPPSSKSYFGKIIDAGFDGVYLDIIDAYEYWEEKGITNAKNLMIDFVKLIASKCRINNPDFGIFPQNSEELVSIKKYRDIITGIGREEVYFINKNIPRNPLEISNIEKYLDILVKNKKLVLTTDYCDKPEYISAAYLRAQSKGYIEYCTDVELDKISINPGFEPR